MKSYISRKLPLETRMTARTCRFTPGSYRDPDDPVRRNICLPAAASAKAGSLQRRWYAPDATRTGGRDDPVYGSAFIRSGMDRVLQSCRSLPGELPEAAAGEGHHLSDRIRSEPAGASS